MNIILATRIKNLRKESDLTLQELAEKLGCKKPCL